MTVLTTHEQQGIDRANTEGKQPVVFVHGLWLLSSSWDNWRTLFEEQGYTTLAPGRPDDLRAVPFRLRQRRRRERSARPLRDVLGARLRGANLPGGQRQSQPVDRSPGRHEESRAWTAADHLGRVRPHRAMGDCPCLLQATGEESRRDGDP